MLKANKYSTCYYSWYKNTKAITERIKTNFKSRVIKSYKSMSEDRLLSALNASKSVKKTEKGSKHTHLMKNKDYDSGEILKAITMPDLAKVDKTIREIKKKIVMKTKYLEASGFYLI